MALLNRERRVDEQPVTQEREIVDERPADRHRYARGVTRGLFTLLGAAAAIFLAWLAAEVFTLGDTSTDFWIAMGLIAGAGLALGLSQLFGGWTKWGVPTISPAVFLLGFLPTLVVGGWILLAKQSGSGTEESRVQGWSEDIGVGGLVNDLATFLPAIPLIIGLVLAFSFDTTGPRTRRLTREPVLADDDYRTERAAPR